MTAKNCGNTWQPNPRRWSSFAMSVLIWTASTLALSSCATGMQPIPAPSLPPPPVPSIQSNLRQQCPEPPLLKATNPTPLDVLSQHDQESALARDCRSSKNRLIQAVDEWQATAWRWYCQAIEAAGVKVKECPRD